MRRIVLLTGLIAFAGCKSGDSIDGGGGGDPSISSIAPAVLTPGASATINGSNFSSSPTGNVVTIGGTTIPVTTASPTQLTVQLPAAASFPCLPTGDADVTVAVGTKSDTRAHPVQVATLRTLAVGERVLLTGANAVRCNELAQTGGQYVAVVYNGDTFNPGSTPTQLTLTAPPAVTFELSGAQGSATAAPIPPAPALAQNTATQALAFTPLSGLALNEMLGELSEARRAEERHLRLLEANTRILRETSLSGSRRFQPSSAASPSGAARSMNVGTISRSVDPTIGASNQVRVPDINANNFCNQYNEVTAKTVYNGTKAIILADVANPDVGDLTPQYTAIGQEFDQVMFPILQTNFGNPLAMDGVTDNNAKVVMVFTNAVNTLGGVAGFVVSCDFFDRTTQISGLPNLSSNFGEFFYAFVPTPTGQTPEEWLRGIRSTIIHEVKHITSFGEHIARLNPFELPALEEGTARHSEEIWARQAIYSQPWKGDITYANSLFCDVRPQGQAGGAQCVGKPFAVFRHFQTLYDYLVTPESFTPLGRVQQNDFNFYASMWSFVRWAADNYATTEPAFFGAITIAAQPGMPNLTARTGRTSDELLGDWLLSLYLDNLAGFTPAANMPVSIATWNSRSIFSGMNADFCNNNVPVNQRSFCRVYPLQPRPVAFGAAYASGPVNVRGGSGAYFEFSGAQTGKQLIDVHAPAGGAPSANLRLAIARIQ
jgi:hypothetical protein